MCLESCQLALNNFVDLVKAYKESKQLKQSKESKVIDHEAI